MDMLRNKICLFAVFCLLLTLTGCSVLKSSKEETAGKKIIVGFAQLGSESAWRKANTESVKSAAKDANVLLFFKNAEGNQELQKKFIKEFIIQRVDVIAFAPLVDTGWDDVLLEAKKANIPVILCDRNIKTKKPDLYVSYIGDDFYKEGIKAANWLVENTKNTKKQINIVELEGLGGSSPAIERKKGFAEVVAKHPNMKIIESVKGDFIRARGKTIMADMLKKYGEKIDVVFAHNDEMAVGAIEAIEEFGLKPGEDILMISVDATRIGFESIISGKLNVSVECTPLLGPAIMDTAIKIAKGETVPRKISPEEQVFTIENAALELPNRKY